MFQSHQSGEACFPHLILNQVKQFVEKYDVPKHTRDKMHRTALVYAEKANVDGSHDAMIAYLKGDDAGTHPNGTSSSSSNHAGSTQQDTHEIDTTHHRRVAPKRRETRRNTHHINTG